jgi:hypothetical protein
MQHDARSGFDSNCVNQAAVRGVYLSCILNKPLKLSLTQWQLLGEPAFQVEPVPVCLKMSALLCGIGKAARTAADAARVAGCAGLAPRAVWCNGAGLGVSWRLRED